MEMVRGGVPGTRIDAAALRERFGGEAALIAHLSGVYATEVERGRAIGDGDGAIALALAAPAFQWH